MSKIFKLFYFLFFLLIFDNTHAKLYKIGDTLEGKIKFSKKIQIPLSEGTWQVISRYRESNYGFHAKGIVIAKTKDDEILEMISVGRVNLAGKKMGVIDNIVNTIIFKDPYDGCYERPEYFLVEFYKKGSTHNCLVLGHVETKKEIFTPDDPEASYPLIKKWINENSIKLPDIALTSSHSYFSRLNAGELYLIEYLANPKIFNSPKLNYLTEETSEFHKSNIHRFPEHKKTMDKWASTSSLRHQYLEKLFKAKNGHLLNLDKLIQMDFENNNFEDIDLVNQIKKLEELFKSGALTEDEFKKAKVKILN